MLLQSTVGVTDAGEGVDNVREQYKLEAKKMLPEVLHAVLGNLAPTSMQLERESR